METAVPTLLTELSADQFGQWRRHPVTELVLDRYFDDFLGTLEKRVIESWLAGKLSLQVEQDARGYIHALRHVQALRLPELRQFWNLGPTDEERTALRHPAATGYA